MGGRHACSQCVNQSKSGIAAGPGIEVTPEHVWSALGVRQLIPTGHAIFAGSFSRADCGLFTQTRGSGAARGSSAWGKPMEILFCLLNPYLARTGEMKLQILGRNERDTLRQFISSLSSFRVCAGVLQIAASFQCAWQGHRVWRWKERG